MKIPHVMLYLKHHIFKNTNLCQLLFWKVFHNHDTAVENADITAAAVLFVEPQIYESTETINSSMNDTNLFVVTI